MVLARVVTHVLARALLHVLAYVIIHVHDYYSKTCVLDMEFTRYVDSTKENMSETDFCRHLLYSSSISQVKIVKICCKFENLPGLLNLVSFEKFCQI